MIKYTVSYGGGLGPDVWDKEMTVEAENIREALDTAEQLLAVEYSNPIKMIFSVEQQG